MFPTAVPPAADAFLHTALGLAVSIFLLMLFGGSYLYLRHRHGDFRYRASARKTVLHSAVALVILIGLWIILIGINVLGGGQDAQVFGIFRENPFPEEIY